MLPLHWAFRRRKELLVTEMEEKRLQLADADASIQGYADGVFWERNTFARQRKA